MKRQLIGAICVGLALSGCARISDSKLNPLNWFGRSTSEQTATTPEETRPLIPTKRTVAVIDARVLIATVVEMRVERSPDGAIIHATGVADTQGYFNAELVLTAVENGVLTYDFRVERPSGFQGVGTPSSRRITVATTLGNAELASIRSIRVRGQNNALSSRR